MKSSTSTYSLSTTFVLRRSFCVGIDSKVGLFVRCVYKPMLVCLRENSVGEVAVLLCGAGIMEDFLPKSNLPVVLRIYEFCSYKGNTVFSLRLVCLDFGLFEKIES